MKKWFSIVIAVVVCVFMMSINADAWWVSYGDFDTHVRADSFGYDGNLGMHFGNDALGLAGGSAIANGDIGGHAFGEVWNGDASADLGVTSGSLANNEIYSIYGGLGSYSESYGVLGGSIDLYADADWPFGVAYASGGFRGYTHQVTDDFSFMTDFSLDDVTYGYAGQSSFGWMNGSGDVDTGQFLWFGGCPETAGANGYMEMSGYSFSESYRFIDDNLGSRTEVMGTNFGAGTDIFSDRNDYGNANISGGWDSYGQGCSFTEQIAPNGGGAVAGASGMYAGSGPLGTDYNSSLRGYTQTSVTQIRGMNGSINSAHSGMSVSSHISGGVPQ